MVLLFSNELILFSFKKEEEGILKKMHKMIEDIQQEHLFEVKEKLVSRSFFDSEWVEEMGRTKYVCQG